MAVKDKRPDLVAIIDLDDNNKVICSHSKEMEDIMIADGTISNRYNATSGKKAINIGARRPEAVPQAGEIWTAAI